MISPQNHWDEWHKHYDHSSLLQARLQIVRGQISLAFNECDPGLIQAVSICAGDGRDLIHTTSNHPRRNDVRAFLIDKNEQSIARGKLAAEQVGLSQQFHFLKADARLSRSYIGIVPANIIILVGVLGHVRHKEIVRLVQNVPMLCKAGGWLIWAKKLKIHTNHNQVLSVRNLLQRSAFKEVQYEETGLDGFAVSRAQFIGPTTPLDPARRLFEFKFTKPDFPDTQVRKQIFWTRYLKWSK